MQFLGEYSCKIDAKGRFRLPAALLAQYPAAAVEGFVLNRGFESCLTLYPQAAWQSITEEMQQLNLYQRQNRQFVRYFFRGATPLQLDKQQRLLLPKNLLDYAQIAKELVLFAYFNRIEVWAKSVYDNLLEEEPGDFADLAESVMGKIEQNSDV